MLVLALVRLSITLCIRLWLTSSIRRCLDVIRTIDELTRLIRVTMGKEAFIAFETLVIL